MDPTADAHPSGQDRCHHADLTTRHGRVASLRALHIVEYALSAPAPRRERTWLHRVKIAVDALADSIDRQIRDDDDSIGLLSEIALSQPTHTQAVLDLRDDQRALSIAVASIREQLDEHPELPIDTAPIRDRLANLAHRYRQHQTREAELIHAALDIDITDSCQENG